MRFQVTELTGKRGVTLTEHRYHSVCCSCGYVTSASRAEMPTSAFGPRLCATVAMLTGVFHLSRDRAPPNQPVRTFWHPATDPLPFRS
jgi:transposase